MPASSGRLFLFFGCRIIAGEGEGEQSKASEESFSVPTSVLDNVREALRREDISTASRIRSRVREALDTNGARCRAVAREASPPRLSLHNSNKIQV